MTKLELTTKTDAVFNATREALQLVRDELNNGQRKKLAKNEDVADTFARYGVEL